MSRLKKAARRHGATALKDVAKAAQSKLKSSPYPAVARLKCYFNGGSLTLRGQVPTFFEKQIAQEAVADLEGVNELVNGVEVI
jgi:osmotically-inducible protein OsmY